jgi:putative ABC transport system permease protein
MFKVTLRGTFSHILRLGLTVVAVIVSVAFMSGTQVLTSTLSTSFDKIFDDVYRNIDVNVRSTNVVDTGFGVIHGPIDESVIGTIDKVDGVKAAEGQVEAQLAILDKTGEPMGSQAGPPTFGLNWLTNPELNGWHLNGGRPPETPTEVVLDKKTATKAGYVVGDTVKIQVNKGVKEFTVVGIGGFGSTDAYASASAALFQTATAQELLVEKGKFTWINVAGDDGVSQAELRNRVAAAVPRDAEAITGAAFTAENQDAFRKVFGFVGSILSAFGLIALFVGAFIIYNTFSIIVTQRTRELALLRALGAGRSQVLGSVIIEALLVGALASGIGLLAGIALAAGLTNLLTSTGSTPDINGLTYPPVAFITSFLLGTIITFLASLVPAWKAARVAPVQAMRDVAIDTTTSRLRVVRLTLGGVLTALGLLFLYLGLFTDGENGLLKVGFSFFFVFIGVVVLGPLFARPLSKAIGAPMRSFTGRLARSNAVRNPKRTATTASALMIGVGLMVVFSILTQSFKASASTAIDTSLAVDYIVDSGSFGQTGLDPSLGDKIKEVPGVQAATGIEFGFAQIDTTPTSVLAADLPALANALKITVTEGDLAALKPNEVAVPKADAKDKGWKVGDALPAKFLKAGAPPVVVGAIYSIDAQFGGGGVLMSTEGFAVHFPPEQQVFNQIFVKLAPGADLAGTKTAIQAIVKRDFPTAKVQDLTEYKASQTSFFDFFLVIISVMLILAIFIAMLGIVNTLLLSVYERTHEIGLLRAVGMARRQVRSTIRWESVIFSLQGTAIGTAIGFGFGWAIVKAASQENPITFAVPWGLLITMVILAMIAGVVAAVIPAFSASRLDVLDAIATD